MLFLFGENREVAQRIQGCHCARVERHILNHVVNCIALFRGGFDGRGSVKTKREQPPDSTKKGKKDENSSRFVEGTEDKTDKIPG